MLVLKKKKQRLKSSLRLIQTVIDQKKKKSIEPEENKHIKSIAFSLINKRIELNKKSNRLKKIINQETSNSELKETFQSFENSSDDLNDLIKNLTKTIGRNLMVEDKSGFREIECLKVESNLESYYMDKKFIEDSFDFIVSDFNKEKLLYRYKDTYIPVIDFDNKVIGDDEFGDKKTAIIVNYSSSLYALTTSINPDITKFSFNESEENIDELFSYLTIDDSGKLGLLVNLTKLQVEDSEQASEPLNKNNNGERVSNITGIQVLIVDDSISIRKFVGNIIESMGYNSILANDGADAVNKINKNKIDLIITDLEMPNVDGLEFIKTVRSMDKHKSTPILVLAGRSAMDKVDDAISLGASSSIVKPFKELELKGKLSEIIAE
jgi:two-component system, chemotaxis family, chemotaxis protein CheY